MKNGITKREYYFLKYYINPGSPTFGNAFKSAMWAGYTNTYARVIKRHYRPWRMKLLKNTLKNDDLGKIIEATRYLEYDIPIISEERMKETIKRNREELGTPPLKEVIRELEELFPEDI